MCGPSDAFRVATTDGRHELPVAPNRLERSFSPTGLDTAWSGDITYIATEEGRLFFGRSDRSVQPACGGLELAAEYAAQFGDRRL